MKREFYIDSYDNFSEVLVIQPDINNHYLDARDDVKNMNIKEGFGSFVKEGDHLIGVFASPEGPVLFFDKSFFSAELGVTDAATEIDDKSGIHRFCITENKTPVFSVFYRDRHGLNTNPYDTSRADIDFFSMLSEGLKKAQFFTNYTQNI